MALAMEATTTTTTTTRRDRQTLRDGASLSPRKHRTPIKLRCRPGFISIVRPARGRDKASRDKTRQDGTRRDDVVFAEAAEDGTYPHKERKSCMAGEDERDLFTDEERDF
jgi:hypothetical protein